MTNALPMLYALCSMPSQIRNLLAGYLAKKDLVI